MDLDTLARAVHVLAVILWIGGVGMVTTALLPTLRALGDPVQGVTLFNQIESRFSNQARLTTLLAGASGFWLLFDLHGWDALLGQGRWWLYPMVLIWGIFTLLLFVLEPLVIHKHFMRIALQDPQRALNRLQVVHSVLLTLSLAAGLAAVGGAHGLF